MRKTIIEVSCDYCGNVIPAGDKIVQIPCPTMTELGQEPARMPSMMGLPAMADICSICSKRPLEELAAEEPAALKASIIAENKARYDATVAAIPKPKGLEP